MKDSIDLEKLFISNPTIYEQIQIDISSLSEMDKYIYNELEGKNRPWKYHSTIDKIIHFYLFDNAFISDCITPEIIYDLLNIDGPIDPIFIDSMTGSGKTTFALKTILPIIKKRNKRMLILSPRTMLKTQVKVDAIKAEGLDPEHYTPKRIKDEHKFGMIDIYSYQECQFPGIQKTLKENLDKRDYGAVIFDEAHYFVQDADFNSMTQFSFEFLFNSMEPRELLRIYMTSTADRIFDIIKFGERYLQFENYYKHYNLFHYNLYDYSLRYFYIERDYSYITPIFFKDDDEHSELLDHIKKAKDTKWLIFVDSKREGEKLQQLIPEDKNALFIDSDKIHGKGKKDDEIESAIKSLTDKNEMPSDILIVTKCLDVGVSIFTKNTNIVCYLKDKTDFLQAIGRKRLKTASETVSLYIPEYSENDINSWRSKVGLNYKENLDANNNPAIGKTFTGDELSHPLYVEKGILKNNRFALCKIDLYNRELEKLKDMIKACGGSASGDTSVQEVIHQYFLSWMPGVHNPFSGTDNSDNEYKTIRDQLSEKIKPYLNGKMGKEQYEELLKLCEDLNLDPRKDQRDERKDLATRTLNNILAIYRIPYKVYKVPNKEKYQIHKLEKNQSKSE